MSRERINVLKSATLATLMLVGSCGPKNPVESQPAPSSKPQNEGRTISTPSSYIPPELNRPKDPFSVFEVDENGNTTIDKIHVYQDSEGNRVEERMFCIVDFDPLLDVIMNKPLYCGSSEEEAYEKNRLAREEATMKRESAPPPLRR